MDTHRLEFRHFGAHRVRILAALQHASPLSGIEPHRLGRFQQHLMITGVLAIAVICLQQRLLAHMGRLSPTRPYIALSAGCRNPWSLRVFLSTRMRLIPS